MCLQIITASIGLYFTAFTIFIGLGLSPRKLDTDKIRKKLTNKSVSEEEINEIIEERIIIPYKDVLEQASSNFKETIWILAIIFSIGLIIYSVVILELKGYSYCGNYCTNFMNSSAFSYIICVTLFAVYLVYDSAKFLMNIRRLI